jgi:hypothetical protein
MKTARAEGGAVMLETIASKAGRVTLRLRLRPCRAGGDPMGDAAPGWRGVMGLKPAAAARPA